MKTMIFGGTYCDSEFKRELVTLWARVARHLNPNVHIALFDSASPFDPIMFLPKGLDIAVFRYADNIGHIGHGGGDGAGRTLHDGVKYASINKYDYAVYWETDCLFACPIGEVLDKFYLTFAKVACLPLHNYQFFEWAFAVFEIPWAVEMMERYDWQSKRGPYPQVVRPSLLKKWIPEWRLQEAAGDELWILPYTGIRNDDNRVNFMNLHEMCPYEPPTWIHMLADIRLAHRFLQLNNINIDV